MLAQFVAAAVVVAVVAAAFAVVVAAAVVAAVVVSWSLRRLLGLALLLALAFVAFAVAFAPFAGAYAPLAQLQPQWLQWPVGSVALIQQTGLRCPTLPSWLSKWPSMMFAFYLRPLPSLSLLCPLFPVLPLR